MTDDPSLPTVDDVARVIWRRAKSPGAGQLPTFDDTTKPPATMVAAHIVDASEEVYGELGAYLTLADVQQSPARRAIAVLAAANIELSMWPEQTTTRTGQSPYDSLMKRYAALLETARNPGTDQDGDGAADTGAALLPRATFPRNAGGMVGWGTPL